MTFYLFFFFQNLNADLQPFVNMSDLPELLLSVCYNANLQRLTVNVIEGKNFKVNTCYSYFYYKLLRSIDQRTHLENPSHGGFLSVFPSPFSPPLGHILAVFDKRASKPMQH